MIELLTYNFASVQLQSFLSRLFSSPALLLETSMDDCPRDGWPSVVTVHFSIPLQNIWGREPRVPELFLEGRIEYPTSALLYQVLTGNAEVLKLTDHSEIFLHTLQHCLLCFAFLLHTWGKGNPCKLVPHLGIGGWWMWFHAPLNCLTRLSQVPVTQRGVQGMTGLVFLPALLSLGPWKGGAARTY